MEVGSVDFAGAKIYPYIPVHYLKIAPAFLGYRTSLYIKKGLVNTGPMHILFCHELIIAETFCSTIILLE